MELLARSCGADEVEQEVTQRDQFNTDAVGLAEALLREAHQNSMDGASKNVIGPVRTRIMLVKAAVEDSEFWSTLLEPLRKHLVACEINLEGLDFACPNLLVIEDFGTTGLLGATGCKDDRNFSDFWRRTGRSHKGGEQGGRWGLGKLVFSSASRIRTFFGLTVQEEDNGRTPLLMGQAVLKNHILLGPPARDYAPHAFFAVRSDTGLQVPASDASLVAAFTKASTIARKNEPGLSIVVPFVHSDITINAMLPHIIRNWFVPILSSSLVVEIGDHLINAASLNVIAKQFGGVEFADGRRVAFISALQAARETPPSVTLEETWTTIGVSKAMQAEVLDSLQRRYSNGEIVAVRAPLTLRQKAGGTQTSFIDLYLRLNSDQQKGEAFFIRGAMAIPGESRRFRGTTAFGAMIASTGAVATFLGDAEGPAHTTWSSTAEKVREKWKNSGDRLSEIRRALNEFHDAVSQASNRSDPEALKRFFNVKNGGMSTTTKRRNPVIKKPVVPTIARSRPQYALTQRNGGFTVGATLHTKLPMEIRVRLAYDVISGNPLSEFSKLDFNLLKNDAQITASGANVLVISENELRIEATAPDFSVAVSGFDSNRDLFVKDDRE